MADIVICPAVLERQAAEQQKPLRDHLAHLLIHGVLHAQGYDHLDDEEAEVMEARETEIMESLGFPNPTATALVWSTIKTRRRNSRRGAKCR